MVAVRDDREEAFQWHLKKSVNYFNTIREAGDLPWFAEGNPKRDERIKDLGLQADVSDEALRRAVFMRRYL